jgi:hypothetical protein
MIDVLELGQYYADVDFVFLDEQDPTYAQFACNEGRSERWNNLPLLYTTDALAPYVATGQRIFMVLYDDQQIRLIGTAAARGWRVEVTRVGLPGTGTVLILNP